ncbi:MAG: DUF2914 domain-containing protein, partial [Gammaproteobacteria bacterium]
MYKFGTMILTATLIATSVHAEETMQQSTVPVTEFTSATNAAMETTQPKQEAQTMPGQPEAAASAETAAGSATEVQTGFNPGTVARSAFTTAIADREPVDTLETIEAADQKIYFFTELLDMQGQTATHRWEFNGDVVAEVAFEVKGPRWRVWSSKNLQPEWLGEWKVLVINSANEVISESTLNVIAATATESTPPATATESTPP